MCGSSESGVLHTMRHIQISNHNVQDKCERVSVRGTQYGTFKCQITMYKTEVIFLVNGRKTSALASSDKICVQMIKFLTKESKTLIYLSHKMEETKNHGTM